MSPPPADDVYSDEEFDVLDEESDAGSGAGSEVEGSVRWPDPFDAGTESSSPSVASGVGDRSKRSKSQTQAPQEQISEGSCARSPFGVLQASCGSHESSLSGDREPPTLQSLPMVTNSSPEPDDVDVADAHDVDCELFAPPSASSTRGGFPSVSSKAAADLGSILYLDLKISGDLDVTLASSGIHEGHLTKDSSRSIGIVCSWQDAGPPQGDSSSSDTDGIATSCAGAVARFSESVRTQHGTLADSILEAAYQKAFNTINLITAGKSGVLAEAVLEAAYQKAFDRIGVITACRSDTLAESVLETAYPKSIIKADLVASEKGGTRQESVLESAHQKTFSGVEPLNHAKSETLAESVVERAFEQAIAAVGSDVRVESVLEAAYQKAIIRADLTFTCVEAAYQKAASSLDLTYGCLQAVYQQAVDRADLIYAARECARADYSSETATPLAEPGEKAIAEHVKSDLITKWNSVQADAGSGGPVAKAAPAVVHSADNTLESVQQMVRADFSAALTGRAVAYCLNSFAEVVAEPVSCGMSEPAGLSSTDRALKMHDSLAAQPAALSSIDQVFMTHDFRAGRTEVLSPHGTNVARGSGPLDDQAILAACKAGAANGVGDLLEDLLWGGRMVDFEDEDATFFTSAGRALASPDSEEDALLWAGSHGASATMQAYVAATDSLVSVPRCNDPVAGQVEPAVIAHGKAGAPHSAAAEAATMQNTTSAEDELRLQLEAKQMVMQATLKVISDAAMLKIMEDRDAAKAKQALQGKSAAAMVHTTEVPTIHSSKTITLPSLALPSVRDVTCSSAPSTPPMDKADQSPPVVVLPAAQSDPVAAFQPVKPPGSPRRQRGPWGKADAMPKEQATLQASHRRKEDSATGDTAATNVATTVTAIATEMDSPETGLPETGPCEMNKEVHQHSPEEGETPVADFYEVTDDEFESLMRDGIIHPSSEGVGASSSADRAFVCDVSDAEFEVLMNGGLFQLMDHLSMHQHEVHDYQVLSQHSNKNRVQSTTSSMASLHSACNYQAVSSTVAEHYDPYGYAMNDATLNYAAAYQPYGNYGLNAAAYQGFNNYDNQTGAAAYGNGSSAPVADASREPLADGNAPLRQISSVSAAHSANSAGIQASPGELGESYAFGEGNLPPALAGVMSSKLPQQFQTAPSAPECKGAALRPGQQRAQLEDPSRSTRTKAEHLAHTAPTRSRHMEAAKATPRKPNRAASKNSEGALHRAAMQHTNGNVVGSPRRRPQQNEDQDFEAIAADAEVATSSSSRDMMLPPLRRGAHRQRPQQSQRESQLVVFGLNGSLFEIGPPSPRRPAGASLVRRSNLRSGTIAAGEADQGGEGVFSEEANPADVAEVCPRPLAAVARERTAHPARDAGRCRLNGGAPSPRKDAAPVRTPRKPSTDRPPDAASSLRSTLGTAGSGAQDALPRLTKDNGGTGQSRHGRTVRNIAL